MPPDPPAPFSTGQLEVGDGHSLYYEQVGSPAGVPVVYLHGGPGSGCTPGQRGFFDPGRHHAVLFDQRGAGRSTPHASEDGLNWSSIDMGHHVSDIEALRSALGIDQWWSSDSPGDRYSVRPMPSVTPTGSSRWCWAP